jgi:cytochrome c-type biogenesis protein CcmH/NrfG
LIGQLTRLSPVPLQRAIRRGIARAGAYSVGIQFLLLFTCPVVTAQQSSHSAAADKAAQTSRSSTNLQQAEALLRQGLFDQAKAQIEDELQHNPSNVAAYNLLGFVYIDQKDYDEAAAAFQRALKIEPSSATIWATYIWHNRSSILPKRNSEAFYAMIPAIGMRITTLA